MKGIVVHDRKLIYWPVPKVAHTTLKTVITKLTGIEYSGWIHDEGIFEWTPHHIEGYTSFAYVRNPFSRIESLYKEKILNRFDNMVFTDDYFQGMPLSLFCEKIFSKANDHYKPQTELIPDCAIIVKIESFDPLLSLSLKHNQSVGNGIEWDERSRQLVIDLYKEDFKKYEYSIDYR